MSQLDRWAGSMREAAESQRLWRVLPSPPPPGIVDLSSNDYLGMAGDPVLRDALREGVDRYGAGATASRLLSGQREAHRAAEDSLARFLEKEKTLMFSSGYAANTALLPALTEAGDAIYSDALNHASLVDGCRLSRAKTHIYSHGDLAALEVSLRATRDDARHAWIVTESVFSMDGDLVPLPGLADLARRHGAWLYVDEAHALGVLGPEGRGALAAARVDAEVVVGTLGKAMGLAGAFVAASEAVVALLINRARSFVYSTGVLPALAAAVPTAVDRVRGADQGRAHLLELARRIGIASDAPTPAAAIVPIAIGEASRALSVSNSILSEGFRVMAIRPPTVPIGTSRLRCVPKSTHSFEAMDRFSAVLQAVLP